MEKKLLGSHCIRSGLYISDYTSETWSDGMDAADILPHANGIIVHDCWSSYWKYPNVTHAICCAHLLCELNGVIENHPEQTWAVRFKKLLIDMKKGKVLNLICRLDNYKESVCLFIKNLCVPFDNNQAERDLRMVKVKPKVSECFRSEEGAQEYLTIMSYIGSARKHGINAFTVIREALNGTPDIIFN